MSDNYPGGKKSADRCTYQEMVDRYWWEIRRVHRLDWHPDLADAHRRNLEAFTRDFHDMTPLETIGEFKLRCA